MWAQTWLLAGRPPRPSSAILSPSTTLFRCGQLGPALGLDVALELAADGYVLGRDVGVHLALRGQHDVTFRGEPGLHLAQDAQRPRSRARSPRKLASRCTRRATRTPGSEEHP